MDNPVKPVLGQPQGNQQSVKQPLNKKEETKGSALGGIILIVVVLALLVWGVSALFGGGSKKKTVNANNTASTVPAQTPQATTASKITAWDTKYGYIFTTIENDFSQMSKDASNNNATAVGNDCQQINTDVTTAQAFPAIPDAQSASDFSSALTYYQEGSSQCVTAINNNDANGLTQASQLMSQGTAKITATANDITKAESQ